MAVTVDSIWRELEGDLRGFIRRRVADDATADDLVQDVFLTIHQRLDTLEDTERVAPWVYRIARNRVVDHYRARKPYAPLPELATADPEPFEPPWTQNELVGAWLRQMIDELPETYREAVRMAEVEGITQREIAERLGLSLSGAKSRVQRGRAELRAMLERCCQIERDRRGNVIDIARRSDCCN